MHSDLHTHEIQLDSDLLEKAAILKSSPYFAIEGEDSLSEKQLVFYVLAGLKPASEVGSYHTEWLSATYSEGRGDDQAGLTALLERLGLCYDFRSPYDGTVVVSLSQEIIAQHQVDALAVASVPRSDVTARDTDGEIYRKFGRLYGYPDTAVEAAVAEWVYDHSALLTNEELARIEAQSGLPPEAFFFRFSRAHWQEELATVRQWYSVLQAYGMDMPAGVPKPTSTPPTSAQTPFRESVDRS